MNGLILAQLVAYPCSPGYQGGSSAGRSRPPAILMGRPESGRQMNAQ
jgi:hypothetical protein